MRIFLAAEAISCGSDLKVRFAQSDKKRLQKAAGQYIQSPFSFFAMRNEMSYHAIASDEMRFSLNSLATSFLSLGSGRKTILWFLIIAEGEKSSAFSTSWG